MAQKSSSPAGDGWPVPTGVPAPRDPIPSKADLGDVIFAIASDVGHYWKSLVDFLGMDARRDVQKIQHECSKAQEGSSSMAQRCTEHMFALWRSRLAQSGVGDHDAADSLIFALQAIPQLAHVADRCKDMLGRTSQTSQTEVDKQMYQTSDSGVFSNAGLTESPANTPIAHSVQEGAPSLQQGQHPSEPAVSTSTTTATLATTATSATHTVHRNETVTLPPSRDSSSVPPNPVSTSQYQSPGMTGMNSFGPTQPLSRPEPQASVTHVSSGGAPLPTTQQHLEGSLVAPMQPSFHPSDSISFNSSTISQQNSPPPSEQPQSPQAQADIPVAAVGHIQPLRAGHDQPLRGASPKSTNSGVEGQEQSMPNVIDLKQRDSLFLVLDVCLRLRKRKMLAHYLGLDTNELDHIMKTEVEPEEQSFQIIKKWIEKKKEDATFTSLKKALMFMKEEACLTCMEHIDLKHSD